MFRRGFFTSSVFSPCLSNCLPFISHPGCHLWSGLRPWTVVNERNNNILHKEDGKIFFNVWFSHSLQTAESRGVVRPCACAIHPHNSTWHTTVAQNPLFGAHTGNTHGARFCQPGLHPRSKLHRATLGNIWGNIWILSLGNWDTLIWIDLPSQNWSRNHLREELQMSLLGINSLSINLGCSLK